MSEPRDDTQAQGMTIAGVVLALIAVILLAYTWTNANRPAAPNQARGEERRALREQIETQALEELTQAAVLDAEREVTRLPIERAIEITAEEWSHPVKGRRLLLQRLARATQ